MKLAILIGAIVLMGLGLSLVQATFTGFVQFIDRNFMLLTLVLLAPLARPWLE